MTRLAIAVVLACMFVSRAPAAQAQSPDATPMEAVAAHDWYQANAMAATYADPVAAKVVTYYRLLTRGAASAAEIGAFIQNDPDWPQQGLLELRWEEALASEPDQTTALGQCRWRWPSEAPALLRCAQAFAAALDTKSAAEAARRAWTGTGITSPADVAAFLSQWGNLLQPADDWARFVSLARQESAAAEAQITRLAPMDQPEALIWVALNADNPDGQALLAALPPARQKDPGLFLAAARFLRRNASDPDAYAFWLSGGNAAMAAGLPVQQHALWTEATYLVRALLMDGSAAQAYDLADLLKPPDPADRGDEEFLAGFIALRMLHDPARAEPHFRALAGLSSAVITQARAHYWRARTLAAEGSTMQAAAEYKIAARWPTTFYGQLAALALGDGPAALDARILAAPAPSWSASEALDFSGRDVARAAAYLVAWDEPRRAYNFLLDVAALAPDPPDLAMAAQLGLGFGVPAAAVGVARLAGLHGTMLVGPGWPTPFQPPAAAGVEPAVTLSLIRQESSFDVAAESGAGALGLMQLMPATARLVAQQQGAGSFAEGQLTADPDVNMTLGSDYFAGLLARFGNCLPLAIAGYNAGPNRVDQWLGQNGDFRTPGGPDVLDWIELIPFNETRNYVERVIEGIAIYRAKEGQALPYPLQPWLH